MQHLSALSPPRLAPHTADGSAPADGPAPAQGTGPAEAARTDLRALLLQLNAMVDTLPAVQLRCYIGAIEAVRDGRWAGSCRSCTSPFGRVGR